MHLTKHHVFGNDFLVRLETHDATPPPGWVRAVCDRSRGIGADGVMWARRVEVPAGAPDDQPAGRPGLAASMRLYNADGGEAEVSGNGLACLAQAMTLRSGLDSAEVAITTVAGRRRVVVSSCRFADADDSGEAFGRIVCRASVDLGQAAPDPERTRRVGGLLEGGEALGDEVPELRRAGWVSVGNPHLVVLLADEAALEALNIERLGAELQSRFEPVNVEAVAILDRSRAAMRVFERGVGVTSACGSGAVAVAWLLRSWGLAEPTVAVEMPGGTAEVSVGSSVELSVPVIYVGDVEAPEPAGGGS